jgi:hypothetical protein
MRSAVAARQRHHHRRQRRKETVDVTSSRLQTRPKITLHR